MKTGGGASLDQVHECVEEGRVENRAGMAGIRSRMRFDGSLNILGMVTLLIMAGGGLIAAVKWTDHVDQTLVTVGSTVKSHSDRLDHIEAHLGSMDSSLAVVASSVSGQRAAIHHYHRSYRP